MDPINKHQKHHHILSNRVAFTIGGSLLVLTGVTVWIAGIDLGAYNFIVAMAIATTKALLVALFFMNLIYDRKENGVIFATSFLFLAIFFVLTSTDLFFRGDVYLKGPIQGAETKSKFKKPWISTPELVAHGKELFAVQCVACHGPQGKGDGAAAAALNPHPRNFTQDKDWVNGRKPSQVFKTLKEGIPGSAMASFSTLSTDDRWSLDAYVLSLGPKHPDDTVADLQAIGIDPTKDSSTEVAAVTVPIEVAMRDSAQPAMKIREMNAPINMEVPGAHLYQENCAQCHGDHGQGGMRVSTHDSASTPSYLTTDPLMGSESLASQDAFTRLLDRGIPGGVMPSYGQFSSTEMGELYRYIQTISK